MTTNRRTFLRGLGTVIALPALEYFQTTTAHAQAAASGAKRVFFFYIPNGANFRTASGGGALALSDVLSPLNNIRDYVTVINGLQLRGASAGRAGDHARAASAFLTCVQPMFPGPGVTKSFDQMLAETIGSSTRVGSLTLGGENGGGSDSGYSPAYVGNLSWLSASTPNTKETDPIAVFNRLFSGGTVAEQSAQRVQRFKYGKSVLDFVRDESAALSERLGSEDLSKLEEYLTSLREMEIRLGLGGSPAVAAANCQSVARPTFNGGYDQRVRAMYELTYHALACGMTRVGSFLLGNEGSGISYGFIGVQGGHHEISHDGSQNGRAKIDTIVKWHAGQLAAFAERLRATPEGNGNMLDHSILVFASGINDGTRHNHDQLPVLIVGRGGMQGGRVVDAPNAPLANLYVSIAKAMQAPIDRFADSTGALAL